MKGQTLAGLINNAGIANHAVLMHQPIEEFRKVLEINLVGTLAVIQANHYHRNSQPLAVSFRGHLLMILTCRQPLRPLKTLHSAT